jgi:hypothetical protein
MNKNRKESRQTGQLEKKLTAYSLAGAAALAGAGAAKADIAYFPNVDKLVSQTGSYTIPGTGITLTADDDVVDLTGPPPSVQNNNEVTVDGGTSGVLLTGLIYNNVAALAFGALIDPNGLGTTWSTSGGKLVSTNSNTGVWPNNGGSAYMGFYFGDPGSPQAGWAQIATIANGSTSSFELLSYAYETSPNVAIDAGQTAATPEPSALPLLVLGGAGLIALRRRRAANA